MNQSLRRAAVGIPGFCAFFNLYGAAIAVAVACAGVRRSPAQISLTMTATTLAIALSAPFAGAIADVLGRKRVIVAAMIVSTLPLVMIALAPNLPLLIFWRFLLGLALPPIFTVVVAYIGEEWPASQAIGATGAYMAASSFGGFCGRFVSGPLADLVGWRSGFMIMAAITLACGLATAALLPREKNFVRSEGLATSARQMVGHLTIRACSRFTPSASASCSISSRCSLMWSSCSPRRLTISRPRCSAPSSYVSRRRRRGARARTRSRTLRPAHADPRHARGMGLRRTDHACPVGLGDHRGLAIAAGCGFVVQATSTASVALAAESGRTSAIGLYATCFYIGGSFGAILPGLTWDTLGWTGCVIMVLAMQALMAVVIAVYWRR